MTARKSARLEMIKAGVTVAIAKGHDHEMLHDIRWLVDEIERLLHENADLKAMMMEAAARRAQRRHVVGKGRPLEP